MKHLPNIISIMRIILSICLLIFEPFKIQFWCIYIACGFSDIADGYLARKLKVAGKTGAILDSVGDWVFAVLLVFFIVSYVSIPAWSFIWIGFIVFIKLLTVLVGYFKFHAFTALHTYANKSVGILSFIGLPIYIMTNSGMVILLLLIIAVLAALEELMIIIKSKILKRDVKSIF